jgi:hypothetical protein
VAQEKPVSNGFSIRMAEKHSSRAWQARTGEEQNGGDRHGVDRQGKYGTAGEAGRRVDGCDKARPGRHCKARNGGARRGVDRQTRRRRARRGLVWQARRGVDSRG